MFNQDEMNSAIYQTVDLINAQAVSAFNVPPATLMGAGAVAKVGEALSRRGIVRAFVLIDEFLLKNGLADGMFRSLERQGIAYEMMAYPQGEPDSAKVEAACAQLRASVCDAVIAFGGGSVLDTAKAIAVLALHPGLVVSQLVDPANITRGRLPLVAIPTTAGTGSEASNVSVVTDSISHIKQLILHETMLPDLAIIDASLTRAVPASLTAATGVDALTHAIEAYVALGANPLTQALAYRAISLIGHALPIAVGQGSNAAAREAMMLGSYLAGMAFSNAGLGLTHAMAHQIGARYGIAHGMANALLLPSVMHFNRLVCKKSYGELGTALVGHALSDIELIAAVQQLIIEVGLPGNLQLACVKIDDFEKMADAALIDVCTASNPRSANRAQIIEIYMHAWQRQTN
ncbi:iron-containing alcohol dehydrogenase family protein [Iodobacter ciconiae]|uniref:Iron-containing alcohol dehydrogenase n=1 Tax=Iodobacter ciconiae TaxID=2496266 RepID=A0A3S8ZVN9_9NEIS|nr:iron-containing alcohol dehydrogenase [Iodobacter ciconiae]AZN37526.1 iron-containing alcohol dehydrogenase [Iodobacter ciconiae]